MGHLTDQSEPSEAELLAALNRVGSDVVFRQKTRRIVRAITVVAIISLVTSVISIYALTTVRDYQVEACVRDNTLRQTYVDQWGPVLTKSPVTPPPAEDAPKEVKDAYAAQLETRAIFKKSLDEGFAQHPC